MCGGSTTLRGWGMRSSYLLLLLSTRASAPKSGSGGLSASGPWSLLPSNADEALAATATDDCEMDFLNAWQMLGPPPDGSYVATYNPTIMLAPGGRIVGVVRLLLTLPAVAGLTLLERRRDLLAEFVVDSADGCTSSLTRVVGEGEDPRLFLDPAGRLMVYFQRYIRWDGPSASRQVVDRQLSAYEWGSQGTLGTGVVGTVVDSSGDPGKLLTARLAFRQDTDTAGTIAAERALRKAASGADVPSARLCGRRCSARQAVFGTCDMYLPSVLRCQHNDGWRDESFAAKWRTPLACGINSSLASSVLAADASPSQPISPADAQSVLNRAWAFVEGKCNADAGSTSEPCLIQNVGIESEKNWAPFLIDGAGLHFVRSFPFLSVCQVPSAGGGVAAAVQRAGTVSDASLLGCSECYEVAAPEHSALPSVLQDMLVDQAVVATHSSLRRINPDLPTPTRVELKASNGVPAFHLNGAPMLRLPAFGGHTDVMLGVVHGITQAFWSSGNVTTGVGQLYVHYFFLMSASPPYAALNVSTVEIPLAGQRSPQPWFGHADEVERSATDGVAYTGKPAGLDVAFVSGLAKVGDSLVVTYGSGDEDARMLRMPLATVEKLFGHDRSYLRSPP